MKKVFFFVAVLLPFIANAQTVYMAGDSTMAIKPEMSFPENGWGMPFARFFDESINVENRAKNGRSTRTFIEEERWANIEKVMRTRHYGFYISSQTHIPITPTACATTRI